MLLTSLLLGLSLGASALPTNDHDAAAGYSARIETVSSAAQLAAIPAHSAVLPGVKDSVEAKRRSAATRKRASTIFVGAPLQCQVSDDRRARIFVSTLLECSRDTTDEQAARRSTKNTRQERGEVTDTRARIFVGKLPTCTVSKDTRARIWVSTLVECSGN